MAVGQPFVENARHGGDQGSVVALAGGTAGELDGWRRRFFDDEGFRPSAGEHREGTTIGRREVGTGNGKRSRVGADRSSGRPPTESERIGDRRDKLITRIPSSGQIHRHTNRVPVSLPGAVADFSRRRASRRAIRPPELFLKIFFCCRHAQDLRQIQQNE
jgi:hypothetical protein